MDRKSNPGAPDATRLHDGGRLKIHEGSEFRDLKSYDLTNPDYKIHDLLPTLELIYQRFSQLFRHSIISMFHANIDVQFDSVDSLQIGDYVADESNPDLQHIFRSTTLKCSGFMAIDSGFMYSLVDVFFSGTGDVTLKSDHELTAIESRIFRRLLKAAADKQTEAWGSILAYKIRLADNHTSPISTIFRSDAEVILLSRFILKLGDKSGVFHIVTPYQGLEPVREKLQAFKFTEQDPEWRRHMLEGVMQAPIEVSSRLCELNLSLKDVLRLRPGQIIQADVPSTVLMRIAGIPVYRARVCTVNNTLALKVETSLHSGNVERVASNNKPRSEPEPEEQEIIEHE